MKRFLLFFAALWLAGMSMMNASTCADLNAVTSTQGINFTLGQVTVVYAKAPYIYVQDATGTALVYSNWNVFKRLVPGDVVHSITGTAKLYSNLPELMPTDSMISKSSGTAPAIPDATAAPTTADINKVFIYRDVDMGSQSFPNGSAANKTGTFSGGSVLFRNAWKEAYQFDATKTYDILGCVSIYGSTIQVYAAEITEHHEMGFNPIVIGAEKPSTWNAMYLYAWADEGTLLGQWPGTAVNVDSAGWAYHTFEGLSEVNYIWNDGNGTQTVDLLARGSVCQRLMAPQPHISNPKWTATTVECGSHETLPSDTTVIGEPITVRLFPSSIVEGWESGNGVFLYAWTGDSTKVLGNWPGYPVDKVNGWYSYTFPAYIQNVNIIWSNGGMSTPNQTENILNVTASTCYSLGYRTTMIDDYATGNIHYEANVVDCASETMLMPLYWVNNQAADGDHVATQPLTVTFAKKPYFYVQDNAGTAGLIYDTRSEWTDLAFNDIITGFEGDVKVYNGLKELIPTLSYVDWGVSNQTEYITIPTATSAPTVADMNKVFRFVNVSFGNASFTTETKKNITATMANGETFAARNQWQEAYTFEANKTYDFTGCVAEYNGTVQVYATNFVEHAGPTPQPGDSTIQDTITLGFGNAFAWDSVYLYAWDDNQNPLLGQWPGTPMTLDSSQWAYKTFIGAGKINYIWNNGKYSSEAGARQTQDLTARASVCQAPDPVSSSYPFQMVSIECGANPDLVFDLTYKQTLAVGALTDVNNPSYYTYRTTGVISHIQTSPENVDRYKNCDFYIVNPNDPSDNSIECYRTRWLHDQAMYADNMPAVGDTVTIVGSLQYYQGRTVEFNRGYIESIARQLPPDTIPQEPITVKLLASSVREVYDCNYVNLYAWRTEPDGSYIDVPLGGWPGTSVPLDSATGWYHYTFAPEIQDVNIIWSRWCDGGYRQTQNIMHVTSDRCYRLMQDSTGVIAVGADCSIVEPILPDTVAPVDPTHNQSLVVKLQAVTIPETWQQVRIYSWSPGVDPAVSTDYGLLLTEDSLGWYSYTFQNVDTAYFLFNNGSWGSYNQTLDAEIYRIDNGKDFVQRCLTLGDPTYTERHYYQLWDVDCVHPDTIPIVPVDTNMTHKVYIYDNITRVAYDSIEVVHGQNVLLLTSNLPTYEGYHFVFWEVGGAYCDGFIGNVTSDMYAQAKFYIDLPEELPANPITVRIDPQSVPESWENIYIYSWTEGAMEEQWPGAVMTRDAAGWLTYTFPAGVQNIDFLIDNGNGNTGNQTVDVDDVNSNYCFRIANPLDTNGLYMVYPTECPVQPQPQGMTIRLMEEYYYGGWYADNYIYAWQHDDSTGVDTPLLGEWPGQPMEFDGNGWWTYTFAQEYDKVNIVFNSFTHSVQTVDILNVTESSCFQIGENLGYFDGMYVHECARVDCSIAPSMYHIVYFFGLNDSYLGMSRVVEGQAAVAPEAPVVPGYTFVGWDQDFSHVMGQMTVHAVYEYNGSAGTGIQVRFKSPQQFGWQQPKYIYAWVSVDSVDTPILGEWPGQEMTLDTVTNWYTYRLDSAYTNFNVVISAPNAYTQTYDITGITEDICVGIKSYDKEFYDNMYHYQWETLECAHNAEAYKRVFFVDLDNYIFGYAEVLYGDSITQVPVAPERPGYVFAGWDSPLTNITENQIIRPVYEELPPVSDLKVRLIPTHGFGWESVYIYAWAEDENGEWARDICGSWPGTLVPVDSLGWCSYTFAHDSVVNIIWNDGVSGRGVTHQTQDIKNVSASTCYRLYGRDSIGYTIAETVECTVNPNIFYTVAFVDQDFDNELLMIAQEAHGFVLPISPTIPYHEGIVFKYWVDVATMQEYHTDEPITRNMLIDEMYERALYPVYLVNWNGSIIASGQIYHGNSVNNIDAFSAYREGYDFIGWSDSLQNITSVRISVAQFRPTTYGNTSIIYADKDAQMLDIQNVDLNLPEPPTYEGYSFIGWQVVSGDLNNGIMIQAAYRYDGGTGAPEVGDENRAARKVIRDEKVYIITPEGKVFSSDGKLVEVER